MKTALKNLFLTPRDQKPIIDILKQRSIEFPSPRLCVLRRCSNSQDGFGFKLYENLIYLTGVLKVKEVLADSPAESAGLRKNDVIIEINEYQIDINSIFCSMKVLAKSLNENQIELLVLTEKDADWYQTRNIKVNSKFPNIKDCDETSDFTPFNSIASQTSSIYSCEIRIHSGRNRPQSNLITTGSIKSVERSYMNESFPPPRRCLIRKWLNYRGGFGFKLYQDLELQLRVDDVVADSPAQMAGLHKNHLIVEINGKNIQSIPFLPLVEILKSACGRNELEFLVQTEQDAEWYRRRNITVNRNFPNAEYRETPFYLPKLIKHDSKPIMDLLYDKWSFFSDNVLMKKLKSSRVPNMKSSNTKYLIKLTHDKKLCGDEKWNIKQFPSMKILKEDEWIGFAIAPIDDMNISKTSKNSWQRKSISTPKLNGQLICSDPNTNRGYAIKETRQNQDLTNRRVSLHDSSDQNAKIKDELDKILSIDFNRNKEQLVGKKLHNDRYNVIKKLGRGGYGCVYLCEDSKEQDRKLNRKAIKTVSYSVIDKLGCKDLLVLKQIKSEYVIEYYDHFEIDFHMFIVVEYCEKGDLKKLIDKRRREKKIITRSEMIKWIYQSAKGLCDLHARNIIHRDIKPENIFLTARFDIKLGDLGISKILEDGSNAGLCSVMCTFAYLSSEIIQGQIYYHNTDIWSLGCVAYELMFMKQAFSRLTDIRDASLLDFTNSNDLNWVELIKNMLIKIPENRPSAADVVQCLEKKFIE